MRVVEYLLQVCFNFVLALIIKLVGIKRVMRFLPPVVTDLLSYALVFHLPAQLSIMLQQTGFLQLLHLEL